MPTIKEILNEIEQYAPRQYQENYDNARLLTGNKNWQCSGALLSLDCVESIVDEAIEKGCNLIVAHHPIVFSGLKSLTGANYVERTMIKAIKNDIAIYASHTNLDNMWNGVNAKIAEKMGLVDCKVLVPKQNTLVHLTTFVPTEYAEPVRQAMFDAGAGQVGHYSQCSFNITGVGTFKGNEQSNPQLGERGELELVEETRVEVIVAKHLLPAVIIAMKNAHQYEEVAYYAQEILNENQEIGSGMIGTLPEPIDELTFLNFVKKTFGSGAVRYTNLLGKPIEKVALCGGAGSFLLPVAIANRADVYVSADFKYHEFFDAENQILIADIGHFESEQFTSEIFSEIITKKYSNFAVHFSTIDTNPIKYL